MAFFFFVVNLSKWIPYAWLGLLDWRNLATSLVLLGVEPLVAHFFVFYYGVLADITPPVALAAYAAAGMAGSDPFKTGNMAFRLGLAKALVPFVFVFSPSLILVAKGFNWPDFVITFSGCVMDITLLGAALSKFFLVEMKRWERWLFTIAALLMVAPSLTATLVGVVVAAPADAEAFAKLAGATVALAEAEGLPAHARSASIRL